MCINGGRMLGLQACSGFSSRQLGLTFALFHLA